VDPLLGFISVPRLAGSTRPVGAFFSATVEGPAGAGHWKINLDGKILVVASSLGWAAGQVLKLKLVDQGRGSLVFQVMPPPAPSRDRASAEVSSLALAFLSQGLPAVAQRLNLWSRWLAARGGLADKETWAASLEARGIGPHAPLTEALAPWLTWLSALETGQSPPPPEDETCWDEWNLRKTVDDAPWLVIPIRWDYQGLPDAGLLQAHWNPRAQRIDRWHFVAAPAQIPFRLEASSSKESLDLLWRFYRPQDQRRWESWVHEVGEAVLSTPELPVSLRVAGPPSPISSYRGGIDVEA